MSKFKGNENTETTSKKKTNNKLETNCHGVFNITQNENHIKVKQSFTVNVHWSVCCFISSCSPYIECYFSDCNFLPLTNTDFFGDKVNIAGTCEGARVLVAQLGVFIPWACGGQNPTTWYTEQLWRVDYFTTVSFLLIFPGTHLSTSPKGRMERWVSWARPNPDPYIRY